MDAHYRRRTSTTYITQSSSAIVNIGKVEAESKAIKQQNKFAYKWRWHILLIDRDMALE